MTENLESIKAASKERIRQVIFHFSTLETVRSSLQAKVDNAIDQISSISSINGRLVEENITLKRFFVVKIAKSDTLKALIAAALILVKYSSDHAGIASIVNASLTFYELQMRPILASSHDRDNSLQDFTKWMFIATQLVGISLVYNQGLLLNICATLENIEARGGIVLKYPTGGGKTDAVKRRLLVYELMAGNESEAERYRSEILNSIASKPDRKRAGNHALILVFKPEEEKLLAQWPEDNYATLRDQLSHHAHLTSYSTDQLSFLEAVHCMFADIPYFAAILYRPLAIFYEQLITWKSTNPVNLTHLSQEHYALHNYLSDSAGARLEIQRNMKTKLYIAMIASKIMFVQLHCSELLNPFKMELTTFKDKFSPHCQFFPGEFDGQDEAAAIEQEWRWMHNFGFIAVLVYTTSIAGIRKVNQDMYFEIAQRLEGSGKTYSKGGDRKPCTERRLVIIEHVTGHFRRSRAPIPAERVAGIESIRQVIHHSPPTGSNDNGKRRRVVVKLPNVAIAPSLPSQFNQLQSTKAAFSRVYDMNEQLRRIAAETVQDGWVSADYELGTVEDEELQAAAMSLLSIQGGKTFTGMVTNRPKIEVDANDLQAEMNVAATDDGFMYVPSSIMLDSKTEESLNITTEFHSLER